MRYVGIKTLEQQVDSARHRMREARIADRVQTGNQIHALLLEFGIVLPLGARGIRQVPDIVMNATAELPQAARRILSAQLWLGPPFFRLSSPRGCRLELMEFSTIPAPFT
jgi:hypothetical protein